MTAAIRLDERDRERLADTVESSFAVEVRSQFFIWTHGALQSMLPHQVLICGIVDSSRQGIALHRFSACRYFGQEQFDAVADPATGLLPKLLAAAEGVRNSLVLSPALNPRMADHQLHALVKANELKNMVALLVTGTRGKLEAFYAFARVSDTLDEQTEYRAKLIAPHVHSAFLRVLANERQASTVDVRHTGRIVTNRQVEILNLVMTGKTNAEIAQHLECSPWTVKNHIQAILRRLDTTSRTHAIARAISLGILQSD